MFEPVREVIGARELLFELATRDIKIRYKQTILGAAWAVCMPILMMVIFTQVFARTARFDTGNIPYPLWVYCGLLSWQFFASSLKGAVESLTRNRLLVTKIYMPREVFPLSQVLSCLVDYGVAALVLAALLVWYGVGVTWTILWLPVVLGVQILFTIALALLVSMGNLFYRDVKYVFEVVLLLWMFASSVLYPVSVDGWLGVLLTLNPMTPIIDAYRQVILLGQSPDPISFSYAAGAAVASAALATYWFHESEYLFAENI